MKTYAVALINFLENNLQLKVVNCAGGWKKALDMAFPGYAENLTGDDIEDAINDAFNQDWLFQVEEVPRVMENI
jgi:hypothetical protein